MERIRESLVKIVMRRYNIENRFIAVRDCFLKLPVRYLDVVEYGKDHDETSEFVLRAAYVELNKDELNKEERLDVMRRFDLSTIDEDEYDVLEEIGIYGKEFMEELKQKIADRSAKEAKKDLDLDLL